LPEIRANSASASRRRNIGRAARMVASPCEVRSG